MKNAFGSASASLQERTAKYLHDISAEYELRAGGKIFVHGDLDLSYNRAIQKSGSLPDLSCVEVGGDFFCEGNKLTSLKGSPFAVDGTINCTDNAFFMLDGLPQHFEKLVCDLGTFHGWDSLPEHLKPAIEISAPDDTDAQLQKAQERTQAIARAMTITAATLPTPVRFKMGCSGGKGAGA